MLACMKTIRVSRTGGPEVMDLVEVPALRPGPHEVLVRVEAAGVNFIDVNYRSGAYARELPFGLGEEGAGVVEAIGPDTTGVMAGQRVTWSSVSGSYATHVIVPAERLVSVPDGVSSRQAAAAMLQGMTADYLSHATFPLAAGHTCLVHAAAGGVGLLLVQMAKRAGARVIGTASTDAKAALARAAGADEMIVYAREAFDAAARTYTGGRGVDVVYDGVGADTFEASLMSLRPRGMLVLFGQASGRVAPLDLQVLAARGSLFVTRPTLRDYVATRAELVERSGRVLGAIARGELDVHIHAQFPLSNAAAAHRDLVSRGTSGKLLLVPDASL
jgi:NADPH2:quinone reductase